MATAADIAGLCERIDAGEDDLLPMLRDALEEMGYPQVQYMGASDPHRDGVWSWLRCTCHVVGSGGHLEASIFDRLRGGVVRRDYPCSPHRAYPTRSAAFLALAAALALQDGGAG